MSTRWIVRFSNRPVGVKRFQTIHFYGVDVAHGLVLLLGIGTKALPTWIRSRGGTIFEPGRLPGAHDQCKKKDHLAAVSPNSDQVF